jgi:hypothetical protein
VQKSLQKNLFPSKVQACVFQRSSKEGSFPLLDLHLSGRLVGGAEVETAFTFEGL